MRISIAGIGKSLAGHLKSMAVLSLLLLVSIGYDLAHSHGSHDSHDGEPEAHLDCNICLKFGQDEDFTQSRELDSVRLPIYQTFDRASLTPQSVEVPLARSRSPPRS